MRIIELQWKEIARYYRIEWLESFISPPFPLEIASNNRVASKDEPETIELIGRSLRRDKFVQEL